MTIIQILTVAAFSARWWSSLLKLWDSLRALQWAAAISALVLTIGAVLEYWDKLKLLILLIGKWILGRSTTYERCVLKKVLIHSLGPILVTLGIAGDFVFEGRAFIIEDRQEAEARRTLGSLSDKAELVGTKTQSAIAKAETAGITASKAQEKADIAHASAETAFKEASSVEGLADKAALEANEAQREVEAVGERAKQLSKRIEAIGPRDISIDDGQAIVNALRIFNGHPAVEVASYSLDGEGTGLAGEIIEILFLATGTLPVDKRAGTIVTGGFESGISIRGPLSEGPFMRALQYDLSSMGKMKDVTVNGLQPPMGVVMGGNAVMGGGTVIGGGGGPPRAPVIPASGPVSVMVGIKPVPDLSRADK